MNLGADATSFNQGSTSDYGAKYYGNPLKKTFYFWVISVGLASDELLGVNLLRRHWEQLPNPLGGLVIFFMILIIAVWLRAIHEHSETRKLREESTRNKTIDALFSRLAWSVNLWGLSLFITVHLLFKALNSLLQQ